MSAYVIDKGIPCPARGSHRRSALCEVLSSMEIGDSVLIEDLDRNAIGNAIENVMRNRGGWKFASRAWPQGCKPTSKSTRVWRMA